MHPLTRLLLALFVFGSSAIAAPRSPTGALLREQGAVYLEDFVKKPVRVSVLSAAPIFIRPELEQSVGVLLAGQTVEVQAIRDHTYRVRGQARQGQVAGWVDRKYLGALKPEFLDALQRNAARRAEIEALIARREVAINMTPEEVASSLGRASKKTSRLDASGRQEVWEYIRYKSVPQQTTARDQFGRLVTSVYYIKVPDGRLSVVFDNNLVSALEQTEGSLERDARVKIITPPLEFAF